MKLQLLDLVAFKLEPCVNIAAKACIDADSFANAALPKVLVHVAADADERLIFFHDVSSYYRTIMFSIHRRCLIGYFIKRCVKRSIMR